MDNIITHALHNIPINSRFYQHDQHTFNRQQLEQQNQQIGNNIISSSYEQIHTNNFLNVASSSYVNEDASYQPIVNHMDSNQLPNDTVSSLPLIYKQPITNAIYVQPIVGQ